MKKENIILAGLFFLVIFNCRVQAQPFINEINQFKKADSLALPATNAIVFAGSSSFTHWKDVQQYFPGYPIINRGFGGSSLTHLILYAHDVMLKYQPRQIVIYCGENDLTGGLHITADSIVARFKRLHRIVRNKLPHTDILYVSMKPSPSRIKYLPIMREANKKIKRFTRKKKRTAFANIFDAMLLSDGSINESLFLPDRLHMNKAGYQLWQPILQPLLKK